VTTQLQLISIIIILLLHVSDGLSVHHRGFGTVHVAAGICQAVDPEMGGISGECVCVWFVALQHVTSECVHKLHYYNIYTHSLVTLPISGFAV